MVSDVNKDSGFIKSSGWLSGQMLIAMPSMQDPRFSRTVIYMCSHSPEGAMGLVLNRLFGEFNFKGLLGQLNINVSSNIPELPVHFGGPVEQVRGFVLHTSDYIREGTMLTNEKVALTATVEILKDLAEGNGPSQAMLALGYAGWGAGQLDAELQKSGWLMAPPDDEIIFDHDTETKWDRALAKIGVSPLMLSGEVGHA